MKILYLAIIIGVGIVVSGMVILVLTSELSMRTPSTLQTNATDYETQRIFSFCKNPEITKHGNDVFIICNHPKNFTDNGGIYNLPLPMYKRIVCRSTYGCSGIYSYIPQIPQNLLSESQKQQVIDKALNVTGLKEKYPGIQVGSFMISSRADQWYADVQFLIPDCNWYPDSRVNLNTMQVIPSVYPPQNSGC